MLLLAACSSKPDEKPPPPPPDLDTYRPHTPEMQLSACDGMELSHPYRCRQWPFDLVLDAASRSDVGTVTDFTNTVDEAGTWLVEVVPRIAPASEAEIAVQMGKAAHVVAFDATLKPPQDHHQLFDTPKGLRGEVVAEVIDGWVVIRAVVGKPGEPHGLGSAPANAFLAPLKHVQPDQGFVVDEHGVRLPARAWRFPFVNGAAEIYAMPDLHATLGVRPLQSDCAGLDTDDPKTFVALRAPTGLTVDTVERVPGAIRVTTKDERPSIYALVCRDHKLIEVGLRGLAITPEMRALLDQLIQPPGSAIRDASSSRDRAQ